MLTRATTNGLSPTPRSRRYAAAAGETPAGGSYLATCTPWRGRHRRTRLATKKYAVTRPRPYPARVRSCSAELGAAITQGIVILQRGVPKLLWCSGACFVRTGPGTTAGCRGEVKGRNRSLHRLRSPFELAPRSGRQPRGLGYESVSLCSSA